VQEFYKIIMKHWPVQTTSFVVMVICLYRRAWALIFQEENRSPYRIHPSNQRSPYGNDKNPSH
jgi:hypothetical protein